MALAKKKHYLSCAAGNDRVPIGVYNYVARHVKKFNYYGPRSKESVEKIQEGLRKSTGHSSSVDQIGAIMNVVTKGKIIQRHSYVGANIAKISARYANYEDILTLSRTYDFPPLGLLRSIFLFLRVTSHQGVHDLFCNEGDVKLSKRDMESFRLAEENDAEAYFRLRKSAEIANKNEKMVAEYFSGLGIGLLTEEELIREQKAELGRAVITPDVLFVDEVYMNGNRVYWLDYKDYVATPVKFMLKKNREQAAKYAKKWGPGVVMYHYGAVEGVELEGAMIIGICEFGINLFRKVDWEDETWIQEKKDPDQKESPRECPEKEIVN